MQKYRRIDVSTTKGLKQAERLVARGWKIIQTGLFTILLGKKTSTY